jgi:hypothetical protein
MKAALEKEIQVVETLISQLKKCMAIYHKNKKYEEIKATLRDLKICKQELERLILAKEAIIEAEKGAVGNAVERSGTSIS